jgi:hypothetical protein
MPGPRQFHEMHSNKGKMPRGWTYKPNTQRVEIMPLAYALQPTQLHREGVWTPTPYSLFIFVDV